jgi:hypothetical protein
LQQESFTSPSCGNSTIDSNSLKTTKNSFKNIKFPEKNPKFEEDNGEYIFANTNIINDEFYLQKMLNKPSIQNLHNQCFQPSVQNNGKNIFSNNIQFSQNQDQNCNNMNRKNNIIKNMNSIQMQYFQKQCQKQYNQNPCHMANMMNNFQPNLNKHAFAGLRENNNMKTKSKRDSLDESYNHINIENILKRKDKRTTIMIRHIPNKYNISTLLEEINIEFKNKYDLFYLPIDYVNNCNLGFAFINFTDPMHIISFYDMYRGKKWKRFNSWKICELAYAKFQGKKDLINHFEKGSVLHFDSEDKKPLILPTPCILQKVSLPIKFFDAFIVIYPYASFHITGSKFIVENFFNY